jgi:hypothetical protein
MRALKWVVSGVVAWSLAGSTQAADIAYRPEAPTYRWPIEPRAGKYLICAKAYKGDQARMKAEELAEFIRTKYKLPAYLMDWGKKQRDEEKQRVEAIQKQQDDFFKQIGAAVVGPRRIKTIRFEEEFAVLIGGAKEGGFADMDVARKMLDQLRKVEPPPARLSDQVLRSRPTQGDEKPELESAPINPFLMAFVVPNPTVPREKIDLEKEAPDPLIFELNSNESFSVLKCSKPFTLVVRIYQGGTIVKGAETSSGFMSKIGLNSKSDLLTAAALQAHSVAEALRKMKPSFDAHVLHARNYSVVCIGQYDSAEDPALLEMQKTVGNMKLGHVDQLMASPMPMKIPRKR